MKEGVTVGGVSSPSAAGTGGQRGSGALSSDVYEQLRRAIVEGVIRPNERLVEAELAERLGVSRTPIRESLPRLGADGLIENRRRGWVVREHSAREIREIYELRAALEGYAARLATERATDDTLREIADVHQRQVGSLQETARTHLVEHNEEFHDAVIRAADNERLAEQIRRNREYYFIHRVSGFLSDDEVRTSIESHQELVQALMARDPGRAESVARARILQSLERTLAKLR
jgi:DNA-binding GntR family transcriptional regulator